MEFNSIEYILFLITVFVIYQFINRKQQLILLLAASYFFYGCWNAKYTILIVGVTIVSYFSALLIKRYSQNKKIILILSIASFLQVLFLYKYFNFFTDLFNYFMSVGKREIRIDNLNLLLPVGISFYTFQAISYDVDVYRGECEAETDIIKYALYIAFSRN